MDREVTLYTKSGWREKVRLDDKTFSQILAPLIELGDEAAELELTGSVGEAFEREWNALIKLKKRWRTLHRSEHEFHYVLLDGESLYLHELRVLPGLLELPSDWQLVVGAMSNDPQYKQHIKTQADIYRGKKIRFAPMYVSTMESTLYGAWGLEPMQDDPYLAALIVNRHATKEELDTVAHVDWELAVELNPNISDQAKVVLLSLAGKGKYTDKWEWKNLRDNPMVRFGVKGGLNRINITYNHPVAELYRYAIRLFPDDVDPHKFGLSYLLDPSLIKKKYISGPGKLGKYAVPNDLANVAVWVHMNITMIAYNNDPKGLENTFVEYALEYIIGAVGSTKILLSLLHYVEKSSDSRADEIASIIESKIEKGMKTIDEFPPYMD